MEDSWTDLLPDFDSKLGALITFFVVVAIRLIWRRNWKIDIIAKSDMYDDEHHAETREIVDEHTVKIAVHDEKHITHEKRFDKIENDRASSGDK